MSLGDSKIKEAMAWLKRGAWLLVTHGIIDGHCTCGAESCKSKGKHPVAPLVPNGLHNASNNPWVVTGWLQSNPNFNYAIVTGKKSGFYVIDVDDKEGVDGLENFKELEKEFGEVNTWEILTGGGGRHLIFKVADSHQGSLPCKTNWKVKGCDLRGDNGYIIGVGSSHISGRRYEWESDHHPDDCNCVSINDWSGFDEILQQPERPQNQTVSASLPIEDRRMAEIESALDSIPADDYESWINIGMSLRSEGIEYFALWDKWSQKSDKYDTNDMRKKWHSFKDDGGLNIETVFHMAQEEGWINETDATPQSPVVHIPLETEKNEKLPQNMMKAQGVLGDIVKWINDTSLQPQPILALGASLTALGTVYGRRYRAWTDLRTNLYTVGLSETASGKEHARTCIKKLFHDTGESHRMGGGDFASGSGILRSLRESPSRLFLLNEFGHMLKEIARPSGHKNSVLKVLLELYSDSNTVAYGAEYANGDGTRPREDISNPCACVYATSVPSNFYGHLHSDNVIDGFLPRFLVFESSTLWQKRRDINFDLETPKVVLNHFALMRSVFENPDQNLAGMTSLPEIGIELLTVFATDEAKEQLSKFEDFAGERIIKGGIIAKIWSRAEAHVIKIATILAIGCDPVHPRVTLHHVEWSCEVVRWSLEWLAKMAVRKISDNEQEQNAKRVEELILTSKDGMTKSEIIKKSRWLRSKDRNDILNDLEESGHIVKEVTRTVGRGKNRIVYKRVKGGDER